MQLNTPFLLRDPVQILHDGPSDKYQLKLVNPICKPLFILEFVVHRVIEYSTKG